MTASAATKTLEAMYLAAGLPCELDAGPVGIVVYAATPAIVSAVANGLAKAPRSLGVWVRVEDPCFEPDENPATAYVAAVCFDWDAMPFSASTCVGALGPVKPGS